MNNEKQFIKAVEKLNFKVKELFISKDDKLNVYYEYHYQYNLPPKQCFENEWKYSIQSLIGDDFQSIYNEMVKITEDEMFQNLLTLKPITDEK